VYFFNKKNLIMQVLILAGGYGSRLSEETELIPKPLVEIGGKPIIWHIMKIYSYYGFNEFIILLGYKGYLIKEYFTNYFVRHNDIKIDLLTNNVEILNNKSESWKIILIDTGIDTMTGGRIKRVQKYLNSEQFLLTYGDGVGDINIKELIRYHNSHKRYLTLTSAQPEGRFGALDIKQNGVVSEFLEKPKGDGAWINAGFFVCEPEVFNYLIDDTTILEREPLENLAKEGQLYSYKHYGFWQPMDTLRDKRYLEKLWNSGIAKWKIWN